MNVTDEILLPLTLFTSDRFIEHRTPPGHPESAERAEVMAAVAQQWAEGGGAVTQARPATDEELERVHDPDYVRIIAQTAGRAVALDPDTFTSPASAEVARLAAGAAVQAVDLAINASPGHRALVLVRPPGHHAERERAMGFCLFNNVAVAAAYARASGVERVAIVDYDVHHGNGTQWIFYDDPSVLFVSIHQYPYYPGSGAATEIGTGDGRGFTVNLAMDAGAGDADYDRVVTGCVLPVVRRFAPGLLLVSTGFDAHVRDPLAGMRMSTEGFARLAARLVATADEVCDGRLVAVTEGGYDMAALSSGLDDLIDELSRAPGAPPVEDIPGDTTRAEAALAALRATQASFWPGI